MNSYDGLCIKVVFQLAERSVAKGYRFNLIAERVNGVMKVICFMQVVFQNMMPIHMVETELLVALKMVLDIYLSLKNTSYYKIELWNWTK